MAKNDTYKVDYGDERLTEIEKEGTAAVKDSNAMYDDMIKQSDGFFQTQIDAVNEYGETQKQNQQAQTDQAIAEIEQQKEYAHQDYLKEQTGAYTDWKKQSDQYGVNAEQMAAQGMAGTGFSESSQVAMYNAYQNRVATARQSYQRSVDNYNNAIAQARLQNNSLLAEIAFNTLKTSLELGLQGFQYKNTLLQAKADSKRDIENTMWSRYTDTLSQINNENAMAEQVRQFNKSYQLDLNKYKEGIRQFDIEIARLKAQDKKENEYKIKQLEEEKRQFDLSYGLQKKNSSVSGSGGSGYYLVDESVSSGGYYLVDEGDDTTKPVEGPVAPKNTTEPTNGSNPKIDMDSVIALGYGPISASKLNELVNSGEVVEYVENGKIKFMKKPSLNSKDSFKTFLPSTT